MRNTQYLSFLGKLFHLAADHDLSRLKEHAKFDSERGALVLQLINNLDQITHNKTLARVEAKGSLQQPKTLSQNGATVRSSLKTFLRLLSSREIFDSNEDVAMFLAPEIAIQPRAKESRERLVGRIEKSLDSASDLVFKALRDRMHLRIRRNSSFISKWSNVIQNL